MKRVVRSLSCVVTLALLSTACPPLPPPTPPDAVVTQDFGVPGLPICAIAAADLPTLEDICADAVTDDNLACVRCKSAHSCLDNTDVVYCVVGTDCKDPKCHLDVASAARAKARVKRRK